MDDRSIEGRAAAEPCPPEGEPEGPSVGPLVGRSLLGGALMGLANLVPGISGGTMLLAAGVYPRFIAAVGEVTSGKLRRLSLVVLGSVVVAAALAVALLAGPVKELVVHQRWVMYSLFIGLTLGGVPVVWRLVERCGPVTASVWSGAAVGFAAMGILAWLQATGNPAEGGEAGVVRMFVAGVAGASAMILPGVSGGYLLLLLGVYVPLLAAISDFVEAAKAVDLGTLLELGTAVIVPVGVGVVVGVVGVSNLVRWLLERFERATLGFLLGLLLGAVLGLWPFQEGVEPELGTVIAGQTVVESPAGELVLSPSGELLEAEDWPPELFTPTPGQVAASLALVLLGFGATMLIDRFGREEEEGEA